MRNIGAAYPSEEPSKTCMLPAAHLGTGKEMVPALLSEHVDIETDAPVKMYTGEILQRSTNSLVDIYAEILWTEPTYPSPVLVDVLCGEERSYGATNGPPHTGERITRLAWFLKGTGWGGS